MPIPYKTPGSLALIGANGMLAGKVRAAAAVAGYQVIACDLPEFDLTDRAQVLREMARLQPQVIVNCAAYTNVDAAESDEELAGKVNGAGPGYLAEAARTTGAVLVQVSTDYVFDGRKAGPYLETDPVGPLSAYGRSKLAGEQAILDSGLERYLIIRTSWLHGPGGKNFVATILRLAREREELRVVADQVGSPTYTGDLAAAILRLLAMTGSGTPGTAHGLYGIYHFANAGQCSWHDFAEAIVAEARRQGEPLAVKQLVPITTGDYPLPAPRPAWSVLSSQRYREVCGDPVPSWQDGLARHLAEICDRGRP